VAAAAGAQSAGYVLLRLPWELKELFKDWLQHHFPLKAAHVMSRVREMRGGRENDPAFGARMRGETAHGTAGEPSTSPATAAESRAA
jgi:DNA repair photolyase